MDGPITQEARPARRPVTDILGDLLRDTTNLMHNEVRLIRAEMSQKVAQVETGAGSMAASAALGFAALLLLLEAAVLGLALVIPIWLSALLIGIAVAIVAGILFAVGRRKLKAQNLKPRESMASLRKDREVVKEQFR